MIVYIYSGELLCEDCTNKAKRELRAEGVKASDPGCDMDSDAFPQYAYDTRLEGGESDTPQHCSGCGEFLENPLTADGTKYVRDKLREELAKGFTSDSERLPFVWAEHYKIQNWTAPVHVERELSIEDLPEDCISECSASGDVGAAVESWREELEFSVNRENAIEYLRGSGAWDDAELSAMDDDAIAEKVLWLACCDFGEFRTWREGNPDAPEESAGCGSSVFYMGA